MVEGECPSLWTDNDIHTLSSSNRSIGSVVDVICHYTTIAVLKCLAGGRWNDTKPFCLPDSSLLSTTTAGDRVRLKKVTEMKVETIIIIVWVLGAILLFTLLVLLMVIMTARHKSGLRQNSRRSHVFTVAARSRDGGGDNPAFTREGEATNWILHRNSERQPPTYREAILGRHRRRDNSESQDEPNQLCQQSLSAENERSRRYAQEYPSCFWEEEPPPPYSLFADGNRERERVANLENVPEHLSRSTTVRNHPVRNSCSQSDSVCHLVSNSIHRIRTIDVNRTTSSAIVSTSQGPTNSPRSTAQIRHHPPLSTQTQSLDISRSVISQTDYDMNTSTATAPLARLEIEYF